MNEERITHKVLGPFWVRKGTMDKSILSEVCRVYDCAEVKNCRVLDIGGHIGSFSMLAHHKGAKSILAYEPDEDSFRLLSMNSYEMKNIIPIRAAVVAHHDKTTDFYKSTSGKNPGNYSTTKFEGRLHTKVPSVNFGDVLIGFRPEVIKFDCEGEEYSLLTEYELPNQVRQVVMEVHLNKPQWRNSVGSILNIFKDWEAVRPPRYTPKSWHFVAGWRR